jgi:hypothetical protein
MKITFIILSATVLLFAHVARGAPKDMSKSSKEDKSAAAAVPPQKPETCKANVNGQEQTLQPGDRYCLDETTHRVCNYGEWIDDKCPEGSKCLKSPDSYRVLCRIINRNPPQQAPPAETPGDNSQSNAAAPAQPQSPPQAQPPAPRHEEPEPPRPAVDQPKPPPPPPPPAAAQEAPKSDNKPSAPQSDAVQAAAPAAPAKPETCSASINGQQQTLQPGDRYCVDETNHRVCNYGEWIDDKCPEGSKCLKSPDSYRVLCRIINRNPPQNPPPSAGAPESARSKRSVPDDKTGDDKRFAPRIEPEPAAPAKPVTCSANINGQEQTLQPGDRYCFDDNTHRVCDFGEWVDNRCPTGSKCLKSPTQWQVLCRQIIRNQPLPGQPSESSRK